MPYLRVLRVGACNPRLQSRQDKAEGRRGGGAYSKNCELAGPFADFRTLLQQRGSVGMVKGRKYEVGEDECMWTGREGEVKGGTRSSIEALGQLVLWNSDLMAKKAR